MTNKIGILAMGHGSSLPHNKEVITKVANMIAEKNPDTIVRIGFMNMNNPTIDEGLEAFENTGVSSIIAVPLFLAHGVHTTEDIPEILGISRENRKRNVKVDGNDVTLIYAEPLGPDPVIADLAYWRAIEALE
ncbi:MAG: sirohydrochlorin cobaltochelatase [Candidatus Methanomarinus sp.]|nr:MAG: sirohydrochlorin cobaltochelatase [ANME-2 cluster archaeon]